MNGSSVRSSLIAVAGFREEANNLNTSQSLQLTYGFQCFVTLILFGVAYNMVVKVKV